MQDAPYSMTQDEPGSMPLHGDGPFQSNDDASFVKLGYNAVRLWYDDELFRDRSDSNGVNPMN